jgi:hypothetical protein
VAPLPVTGTIYVRYYTRYGHGWFFTDQTYTMNVVLPAITTPVSGSTMTSSTATFQWTANGNPVAEWWLVVGSFLGGSNIPSNCGPLPGTTTSCTVSTLPFNSSQIFVRLWYRVGVTWLSSDFQYTAKTGPQVRFFNALVLCDATGCIPFTARLTTSQGFTWFSVSGTPSAYQFVTNTLSNFWAVAVGFPGALNHFDPSSINLQDGRNYVIFLDLCGSLPCFVLFDEGPGAALAPQQLGTPGQVLRGQQQGEPDIWFAPVPDKRRQPSVR